MNRLTHTGSSLTSPRNSSIFTSEASFSDHPFPGYGKSDDKNDFPSQLNTCIVDNQSGRLHDLIQQQPGAWSAITAEELCKLLLQALNKSRSSMVVELIKKSAPGKAAAIPIAMQLELVEAARWTHNEKSEMSELLDALLPDADFPMQHFKQLYAEACKEGKRELMLALSEYEKNFVKMREQGQLPIYDAAAAGDPAKLLKELDARLGIPPLDNRLSGIDWFFNALHRWVAERFTAGAARRLVNQPVGNVPLLHAAVASGNTETVRLLVEKGADLSSLDRHGHTPLSKAKAEGQKNSEIVELLIERHAPDRRPGSGSVAAPTQAASSRRKVTGQVLPHQDDMTGRPGYEETVKSFRNLLPEVVSVLTGSRDLARELNGGELMSAEQAGLFTASYLAEFEPPQACDEKKSGRAPVLQTNLVLSQLHANRDKFRAEGLRLEASKARDIHGVLDNLASTTFADLWIDPRDIEQSLRNAGLCNSLIVCVVQAVVISRANPDRLSATDERRKEIFAARLKRHLGEFSEKRSAVKDEGDNQALYDQLLRRQIAVLEKYCIAADAANAAHIRRETDFSDYIW